MSFTNPEVFLWSTTLHWPYGEERRREREVGGGINPSFCRAVTCMTKFLNCSWHVFDITFFRGLFFFLALIYGWRYQMQGPLGCRNVLRQSDIKTGVLLSLATGKNQNCSNSEKIRIPVADWPADDRWVAEPARKSTCKSSPVFYSYQVLTVRLCLQFKWLMHGVVSHVTTPVQSTNLNAVLCKCMFFLTHKTIVTW